MNINDMNALLDGAQQQAYDTCAMPAELLAMVQHESTAHEVVAKYNNAAPRILAGMRVVESELARMPVRTHKKRRWMSARYHARIQKKWLKRFGTAPCAYLFNSQALRLNNIYAPPIFDCGIRKSDYIVLVENYT